MVNLNRKIIFESEEPENDLKSNSILYVCRSHSHKKESQVV